jgi:hypothetical protein
MALKIPRASRPVPVQVRFPAPLKAFRDRLWQLLLLNQNLELSWNYGASEPEFGTRVSYLIAPRFGRGSFFDPWTDCS